MKLLLSTRDLPAPPRAAGPDSAADDGASGDVDRRLTAASVSGRTHAAPVPPGTPPEAQVPSLRGDFDDWAPGELTEAFGR